MTVIRTLDGNRHIDPSHVTRIEVVNRDRNYAGERGDKRPSEVYVVHGPYMGMDEWPDSGLFRLEFHEGNPPAQGLNGWLLEDLMLVLIDRMAQHQSGPFACDENRDALEYMRKAWRRVCDRRLRRIAEGTSGTQITEPDPERGAKMAQLMGVAEAKVEASRAQADSTQAVGTHPGPVASDTVDEPRPLQSNRVMELGGPHKVLARVDALELPQRMVLRTAFAGCPTYTHPGSWPSTLGYPCVCATCGVKGNWPKDLDSMHPPDEAMVCERCQTALAKILAGVGQGYEVDDDVDGGGDMADRSFAQFAQYARQLPSGGGDEPTIGEGDDVSVGAVVTAAAGSTVKSIKHIVTPIETTIHIHLTPVPIPEGRVAYYIPLPRMNPDDAMRLLNMAREALKREGVEDLFIGVPEGENAPVIRDADVLVERLAELEHQQWSHWLRHMMANMTPENLARWERQMNTPYADLTEKEKESDRSWALRALDVITNGYKDA